jgi:hypothetical protein
VIDPGDDRLGIADDLLYEVEEFAALLPELG